MLFCLGVGLHSQKTLRNHTLWENLQDVIAVQIMELPEICRTSQLFLIVALTIQCRFS